jgi:hypothetical protein
MKMETKSKNRMFMETCDKSEKLMLAVTPSVDNLFGSVNFDLMTDMNFSNRVEKKKAFKKQESPIPYVGQYEDIKTVNKFLSKLNFDEVKCLETTKHKEFSKSQSIMVDCNQKCKKIPCRFDVTTLLHSLSNEKLSGINN